MKLEYLDVFVHNNAALILRLAREVSKTCAWALPLSWICNQLLDG